MWRQRKERLRQEHAREAKLRAEQRVSTPGAGTALPPSILSSIPLKYYNLGRFEHGDIIKFERVTIVNPDGRLLVEGTCQTLSSIFLPLSSTFSSLFLSFPLCVSYFLYWCVIDLNFEVPVSTNVVVTGPNGSGKSSLFRVLGELWPLQNGIVHKPNNDEILFVPQKPYLVLGTLRDQIIYPHSVEDMKRNGVTDAVPFPAALALFIP